MSPKSLDEGSATFLLVGLGAYKKRYKLTWEETAKRINVSIRTVHRWRKTNKISEFYADSLKKFLKSRIPEFWIDSSIGGSDPIKYNEIYVKLKGIKPSKFK